MADDVKISITTKADSSGATQAKNDIKSVSDSVEEAGEKAKKASFNFKEFAQNAGLGATAMLGAIGGVATMAVKSAGEYETATMAFKTLLGDANKAKQEIADIQKQAVETPFNLPELIKANQLLVSSGVDAKKAQGDVLNLGKAVASTGGSSADLLRLAGNLQQIQAIGKASAQDIKQFGFAGIPIYQLLADTMGLNVDQIKDMDIGYTQLTEALASAGAEGGRYATAFSDASDTFQVKFSNLQDAFGIGIAKIANDSGLFNIVKGAISGLTEFINGVAVPAVMSFFDWVSQNNMALWVLVGIVGGLLVAAGIAFLVTFGPMILAAIAFAGAGALIMFVLRALIPIVITVIQWFAKHYEILAFLITFIAVIAIPTIYRYIAGLVVMAITKMATLIPAIIASIAAFGAMLISMLPIIIIAAVIAGAVALLALAWKNNWLGMRDILKPIVEAILKFLKPVIDFINKIIEGIKKLAGIKGSGIDAGNMSSVGDVSTSLAGAGGIPDIPGLGKIASIPGVNMSSFNLSASSMGMPSIDTSALQSMIQPAPAQSIQQINYNYSPIDNEAALRDLAFAVANK